MKKACDHTSVGILVSRDDKLLLIERARFPFGFALPAGHVDDDPTFESAAARELKEETGLVVRALALVAEGRKENCCRRTDGTWHYWKLYKADAESETRENGDEVRSSGWYSKADIKRLAQRTMT